MAAPQPIDTPPPIQCKIELPAAGGGDEQYGGTRTITSAYTFSVDKQIGEGTYGQVFMGNDKKDQDKVALKKIRMDTEKEGFPITAIREIKILSTLKHENVVCLREIVRSEIHKNNNYKGSIYMVFDYCEYDLTGLMETVKFKFTEAQVKCIMKQLLKGLAYVHSNGVLHRDLKASNILIDRNGIVKLADFGLARTYQTKQDSRLTNRVITLWYRPPELLLGSESYGPEIDMWSVGCIFAELLVGKPIFPGNDEADQADRIFKTMGTPTEQTWPGFSKFPASKNFPPKYKGNRLRQWLKDAAQKNGLLNNIKDESSIQLLEKMLALDPTKRISAMEAFAAPWFWCDPMPCDAKALPCHGTSHEFTMKKRRNEEKERQQPQHAADDRAKFGGPALGGGRMAAPQQQQGMQRPGGPPGPHPPPGYSGQPDPKRGRFAPPGGPMPPAAMGGPGVPPGRGGPAYPSHGPPPAGYGGRGPPMPTPQAPYGVPTPGTSGPGYSARPPAPYAAAGYPHASAPPPGTGGPPHAFHGHYGSQPQGQGQQQGYQQGGPPPGYGAPPAAAGAMPPPGPYAGQQARPPAGAYQGQHQGGSWQQKR